MKRHTHILSVFKSRDNMIEFNMVKSYNGVIKPFSLTHANVERVVVSVLGTDPEVSLDSDDVAGDVVFSHDSLRVRFPSLDVEVGAHNIEVVAYKTGFVLPETIFGSGLRDSIQIQMRD